jgi:hypothetical protein
MGNNIYETDGKLDTTNTLAYQLLIEVGHNYYAYAIVDETNKLKAISFYNTSIHADIDNSLLQLAYKNTRISLCTSNFVFIPTPLYSKANENKYAQFLKTDSHIIATNYLLNRTITALHTHPTTQLHKIQALFPLAEIVPQYLPLIHCVNTQLQNKPYPQLVLNLKVQQVEILILQHNKLLFYNVFDNSNHHEILYYTLAACQQNNIIPNNIHVHICGNINTHDSLYTLLKTYFGTIQLINNTTITINTSEFNDTYTHRFFSLLSLSICE